MKAQKFKIVIEADVSLSSTEILILLKKHLGIRVKSLAVMDWDTKEAEGIYEI